MKRIKYLLILLLLPCLAVQAQTIDQMFKAYAGKNSPGFAVGILKGNQVLYAKGYGSANLDYGLPITVNSAFDIASVSKQFTGACIALLILDGKLKLETPASRYIPELAKYKDIIRIEHLIYNTSGVIDYYKLPRSGGRSWVTFDYFDNAECINTSLGQDTLAFKPGTKWDYCNVNFMLLARIVEKVSGEPFSTFARERLFLPLVMNHTLVNDDATVIIANRVTPYNPRTKEYVEAYRKAGFDVKEGSGWIQHVRNSPHYGGSGVNTGLSGAVDHLNSENVRPAILLHFDHAKQLKIKINSTLDLHNLVFQMARNGLVKVFKTSNAESHLPENR